MADFFDKVTPTVRAKRTVDNVMAHDWADRLRLRRMVIARADGLNGADVETFPVQRPIWLWPLFVGFTALLLSAIGWWLLVDRGANPIAPVDTDTRNTIRFDE